MGAPQAGSADGSPAIAGTHEVVDATNDIASAASKSKTASSNAKFQARGSISGATIPLSVRKSEPLDLSSVERKGSPSARPAISHGPVATIAGLREAPIFRPTQDEFLDPLAYIRSLRDEGSKSGIVKIVPPDNWNPPFAIDTESFHFRTRRQELNSVEGATRMNLNYIDQLTKFHRQQGHSLAKFPSVDKKPLDLYKLKKAVEQRGGFAQVCTGKRWAEIGRDLGYSGKIMSSLSTSLKNSYQKWLYPYEEYLKFAKPGVQQKLELENGTPSTPSPRSSPTKQQPDTNHARHNHQLPHNKHLAYRPSGLITQATLDLHAQTQASDSTEPRRSSPVSQSTQQPTAHTAGFTPINVKPATNGLTHIGPLNDRRSVSSQNDVHVLSTSSTSQSPVPDLHSSKRRFSGEGVTSLSPHFDGSGRKFKRAKTEVEAVPTVAGSQMTKIHLPSCIANQNSKAEEEQSRNEECDTCGLNYADSQFVECDTCDCTYHFDCLDPPLKSQPDHDWHCPKCLVGTGEFGFEDGATYSLKQFQEKANSFKDGHFHSKGLGGRKQNGSLTLDEALVEKEFWRLVESITDTVEVEYGADIHTTTHGSGFPTIEKNPRDVYSTDPWNLNILPLHNDSLFRHIKSDISGMTVPWLYVGMCFSTFCWHNEDHYTYSANYQHLGDTKKWYGIPGHDALKFENAMRKAVPELFETQPDLLFQLVTLLPPEKLIKAGVSVYSVDQHAGEFVITFPRAYHAGFNHGFNVNEAVNFASSDWEPFGEAGALKLQEFRRQPCFSHDELLLTAAARDSSIKTAQWLAPALRRLYRRETHVRAQFLELHRASSPHVCSILRNNASSNCRLQYIASESGEPEEENACCCCKAYAYLSRLFCKKTGNSVCLLHAGIFECCDDSESDRLSGESGNHVLQYRLTEETLSAIVERVEEKARVPNAWIEKVEKLLEDDPRPPLKSLRSLLGEGERISWPLPQLSELRKFVERCNDWVEEATNYITRKQQNRRKNEKVWRKSNASKAAEMEERDKELRKVENISRLLQAASDLSFECPEIRELEKRASAIANFQQEARQVLLGSTTHSYQELEDLVEMGRGFNIDIPEIDSLDKAVQQMRWFEERQQIGEFKSISHLENFIQLGVDLGLTDHREILVLREKKLHGDMWEAKANELLASDNVNYQQLDALSQQAASLPVTLETLTAVETTLKKQRDAREKIGSLYERSREQDFRNRPLYKDVRDAMEALGEINGKPAGTLDLEKEQKRHEDWMRKGKRLFGKSNAPLHILLSHMQMVEARNDACFDLRDQPRMPVEPSSRANTPDETPGVGESASSRDVFCICRRPEAGMMIECELCHEWYHGKCLKIARGKVKEDDKYTCPICDYRVKIPRDAARPKLEDLLAWQDEVTKLPFQPEEEECLTRVINKAQDFRRFLSSYINPMLSNPEELTTQRFYLRKIEGADILLAQETNFFKQELHKWAPIAPNPPPLIETSLSTRKPRPTKQQRLMSSLGIEKPEDIPQHLRTRHYNVIQRKARDFHPDASHQSHSQSPNGNPELNQKARSDRSSSIQDESRKPEITHHAALSGATTSMLPQPPMSATATHSFAFDHTQDSSLPVDPLLTSNPTLHSVHPFRLSASDVSTPQTPYFTGPAAQFQYDGHAGESTIGGDLSVAADNLQSSNMDAFFADLTNQDDEGNVNVHENASGKDDSWDADALDQKLVDAFLDVAH